MAWEYRCDADECGRDCSTRYEYRTFHYEGDFECLNIRPYIETGGPYEGYRGWPLQFDGSDSYDIDSPGEQIDEYEWDFGDGNTGSGARPT